MGDVFVSVSMCCWLRQCWRRCVGSCVVVTVQKKNDICNYRETSRERFFPLQFYVNSKKLSLHHVKSVIILTEMVLEAS